MNRDESYLLDLHKYAQDTQDFISGMDVEAFEMDIKTQSAVLYNITILGEAVKRLTPEFRAQHPTIDWKQIAGIRDKLVHEYRRVNVPIVWHVLKVDIPELLEYIEPLLPKGQ